MYALLTDVIIIICLTIRYGAVFSSAETNLKEGAHRRKYNFVVPFHFFLALQVIIRFGERFRDGHYTVWSVSCLLFYTHGAPVPSHL